MAEKKSKSDSKDVASVRIPLDAWKGFRPTILRLVGDIRAITFGDVVGAALALFKQEDEATQASLVREFRDRPRVLLDDSGQTHLVESPSTPPEQSEAPEDLEEEAEQALSEADKLALADPEQLEEPDKKRGPA